MLKKCFFTLALFGFLVFPSYAQTSYKALHSYVSWDGDKEDTLDILAANRISSKNKEWIDCLIKGKQRNRRKKIPVNQLSFLTSPSTFWAKQHFWHQELPAKLLISVAEPEVASHQAPFDYMESDPRVIQFKDVILDDYLTKKLDDLIPYADRAYFPRKPYIKIIEKRATYSLALQSGCIILTTGLLAHVYQEDELDALLITELVHLLFHHLTQVEDSDSKWITEKRYAKSELLLADAIAGEWLTENGKRPDAMRTLMDRIHRSYFWLASDLASALTVKPIDKRVFYPHLPARLEAIHKLPVENQRDDIPDPLFDIKMADLITDHAERMYDATYYVRSLSLVNRLVRLETNNPEPYALKATLLLKLFPDDSHDEEALVQAQIAIEMAKRPQLDFYKQYIGLLSKFERWEDALISLEKLDKELESVSHGWDSKLAKWSTRKQKIIKNEVLIQQNTSYLENRSKG